MLCYSEKKKDTLKTEGNLSYQILGGKTVKNVNPQNTEIWPPELIVTSSINEQVSL